MLNIGLFNCLNCYTFVYGGNASWLKGYVRPGKNYGLDHLASLKWVAVLLMILQGTDSGNQQSEEKQAFMPLRF